MKAISTTRALRASSKRVGSCQATNCFSISTMPASAVPSVRPRSNAYLRDITGEDITAKDFRTWAGTNLAALALCEFEYFDSEATRKRAVVRAVERVAKHLGNTPAVCRRCYIHPAIFDGFLDGALLATLAEKTLPT